MPDTQDEVFRKTASRFSGAFDGPTGEKILRQMRFQWGLNESDPPKDGTEGVSRAAALACYNSIVAWCEAAKEIRDREEEANAGQDQ